MKKLIDELEAYIAKSKKAGQSSGYILGLRTAFGIVRKYNPWHEVIKDGLPEADKLLWFLCSDGSVYLGYYSSFIEDGITNYCWSVLDGSCMTYKENNEIVLETEFDDDYDVTHYRYIPTDLPEVTP